MRLQIPTTCIGYVVGAGAKTLRAFEDRYEVRAGGQRGQTASNKIVDLLRKFHLFIG